MSQLHGLLFGFIFLELLISLRGESYSCNPPSTFEEKIDRIVEYDDTDGDGVITAKDVDRSLILYDTNLDEVVTAYEFVSEWVCRYGDHPDVAHRIFNQMSFGINLLSFEMFRRTENRTVTDYRNNLYNYYTEREISS